MEREKRLELCRVLFQALKQQLAYLNADATDAQLTAHGEGIPADTGTAHETGISPPAQKGGEISGVSRGEIGEVASGPPEDVREGGPPP
jgi:hypothetical protein